MILANIFSASLMAALVSANIKNACTKRGMYAMTWDDGPSTHTGQLLDTLKSKGEKVTFHLTTKYLTDPNVQSTVKRIASDGHLIGLRAEASWNLLQMSDEQIRAGIARQANVLGQFIGYVPTFIRLPYEGYDDRVLRAVESTGMTVTTHNLETYDFDNDANKVINSVKLNLSLKGKGEGSFISIQHDGVPQSVQSAPKVIDAIKSAGYKLVTLDECLGLGDAKQHKKPLEGADDAVDLGPMGDSENVGGMVQGGDLGDFGGIDSSSGMEGNSQNSGVSSISSSASVALLVAVLCALLQL